MTLAFWHGNGERCRHASWAQADFLLLAAIGYISSGPPVLDNLNLCVASGLHVRWAEEYRGAAWESPPVQVKSFQIPRTHSRRWKTRPRDFPILTLWHRKTFLCRCGLFIHISDVAMVYCHRESLCDGKHAIGIFLRRSPPLSLSLTHPYKHTVYLCIFLFHQEVKTWPPYSHRIVVG